MDDSNYLLQDSESSMTLQRINAIASNDYRVLSACVWSDQVINQIDGVSGLTYLGYAVRGQYEKSCKYLLDKKCDPNGADKRKYTPLHLAVVKGNLEIAEMLLQYGADPNRCNAEGETPTHKAFDLGSNISLLELLTNHGGDIQIPNNLGKTAAEMAFTSDAKMLSTEHQGSFTKFAGKAEYN